METITLSNFLKKPDYRCALCDPLYAVKVANIFNDNLKGENDSRCQCK